MSNKWLDRTISASGDVGGRVADASETLIATLRNANRAIAAQGAAGWNHARGLSDELVSKGRHVRKSTSSFIADRPLESVLIIGLVGVAVGWVMRRSRERAAESSPAPKPRRRARAPRKSAR